MASSCVTEIQQLDAALVHRLRERDPDRTGTGLHIGLTTMRPADLFRRFHRSRGSVTSEEQREECVSAEAGHAAAMVLEQVEERSEAAADQISDLLRAPPTLLLQPFCERREPGDVRQQQAGAAMSAEGKGGNLAADLSQLRHQMRCKKRRDAISVLQAPALMGCGQE